MSQVNVVTPTGTTVGLDAAVQPLPAVPFTILVLSNATGLGVPGIPVTAMPPPGFGGGGNAVTDGAGRVVFSFVPNRVYQVTVNAGPGANAAYGTLSYGATATQ